MLEGGTAAARVNLPGRKPHDPAGQGQSNLRHRPRQRHHLANEL